MAIMFHCVCGQKYTVKDELAGRQVKCKVCGRTMAIPQICEKPADTLTVAQPFGQSEQATVPERVGVPDRPHAPPKRDVKPASVSTTDKHVLDGRDSVPATAHDKDRRVLRCTRCYNPLEPNPKSRKPWFCAICGNKNPNLKRHWRGAADWSLLMLFFIAIFTIGVHVEERWDHLSLLACIITTVLSVATLVRAYSTNHGEAKPYQSLWVFR